MSALFTPQQLARLRDNGRLNALRTSKGGERLELQPVIRLRGSDRSEGREWLLSEIDPDDSDLAFAECRRRGRAPERLWLHLSWLQRQDVERSRAYGRVRRVPA